MSDANEAIEFLYRQAPKYAQAKADRVYIEEYRKSKKALLMKSSRETTSAAQERDAYASQEYIDLLDGLKQAIEIEVTLMWQLEAAKLRIEVYRTESANNRFLDKATQ